MIEFDTKKLEEYVSKLRDRDKGYLKDFIYANELLIDTNDFDTLYEKCHRQYIERLVTALLLLSNIDFLPYLTNIPDECFERLPITSITILEGVKSIGSLAFDSCKELTSITISSSVTSIGNFAFCDCDSLTSITIPEGVTDIGTSAFAGCTSLESITIPSSVTIIDGSAFEGCSSLTSITIPEGVTSIGYSIFRNCSGLTSITLPSTLTSIGQYPFLGCNLTSIKYNGTKEDWSAIHKHHYWRTGSEIKKIICNDGEVKFR